MAAEMPQASFLPTGQVPIDDDSEPSTSMVIDPSVTEKNAKSTPQASHQLEFAAPPPAYSESSGTVPTHSRPLDNRQRTSRSGNNPNLIAIPAIGSTSNSPFLRVYPPCLTDYELSKESFLSFLDNLNLAVEASPPLQVLDAAGGILRAVPILFPLHWIGAAVSGIANLSSGGVSKSKTESFIRQANKDIFEGVGLKVEVARLDAVAYMAGIPILDSRGKVTLEAPILQPLRTDVTGEMNNPDMGQRLVESLQPWIAALDLETLPWTSKSRLTRFNAALKKPQAPLRPDDSRSRRTRAEERGQRLSSALDNDQGEKEFKKVLWLVIRNTKGQNESLEQAVSASA